MASTDTTDDELAHGETVVATRGTAGDDDDRDAAPLERGAMLGRYVVIGRLGAGGMGVVYAALDPDLGRRIAVKLVRSPIEPKGTPGSIASGGAARLLREAQAMARLHHPNVIVVHDVGTFDGRVFIAMEYLDGGTLSEWVHAERRPWPEVVRRFTAAGRGLAAAHAAGIVHRDFKSDNVMLGSDGRVCVVDFGLARAASEATVRVERTVSERSDSFETKLTRTGALMGTPAYMAPEQHAGALADARSDQFAFCVALYEGLYGQRPFAGDTAASLAANVLDGALRPPPEGSDVPRWLFAVIARGLQVRPEDRHADMDAVLAALADDPTVRRRRLARRAALGAVALAAVGVPIMLAQQRDEVCTHARAELQTVWNADARQQAHAAFAGSSRAHAAKAWHKSELDIDAYAEQWIAAHTEACEATAVRAEQSQDLLDRRMSCLQRRLREVDAVVGLFARADDAVVDHAAQVLGQVGELAQCSDAAALLAEVPPPSEAERGEVEALRAELARVMVARTAARHTEAADALDAIAARMDAVSYGPVRAEYLLLKGAAALDLGRVAEAETILYDGARVAAEAHDDVIEPKIWLALVRAVGVHDDRLSELPPLIKAAEIAVTRAGSRADDRGALLVVVGTQSVVRGRFTEAETQLRESVALVGEARGVEHPDTLEAREMLALALHGQARYDQAEAILDDVAAIMERTLGASHPRLGMVYGNLSRIDAARGDLEAARVSGGKALDAIVLGYGPRHQAVASAHANLATTLRKLGRYDQAAGHLEAALSIERELFGPASPRIASSIFGIGQLYLAQGKPADALAPYRESLAMWQKTLGANDARCAYAWHGIGKAELALGHRDAARDAFAQALALREAGTDVAQDDLAETRFLLAQTLGRGEPRARELAAKAREAFVAEKLQNEVDEVDRWLAGG